MQHLTFGRLLKMYKLSLLCPTRKRISGLSKMWESALNTSHSPNDLQLVLYVDNDDDETINSLHNLSNISQVKVLISDNKEIYSNLHNICCYNADAEIIFTSADDLIFRSDNWDLIVYEKFESLPDKIAFLYPNDGYWGNKFGTHGFFHANWFNTIGYISPPIFSVDYSDNYINDLAKSIERSFYMDNIFIEHMHWTFGKSPFDETSKRAHEKRLKDDNRNIYENSSSLINSDMLKLKSKMVNK